MYFDEDNPWTDRAVYVSLQTAAVVAAGDPFLSRSNEKAPADWLRSWDAYGAQLDAYILPSRCSGNHHLGIRYGVEPDQYLSFPLVPSELVQNLLEKSNSSTAAPGP